MNKKSLGKHYKIHLPFNHYAAEKVLNDLHRAGFDAYLVGGAVRDLLLGVTQKDFDVATNATPEQVNQLFSRSKIIGKRFKIVHVMVGKEIIEVSTFRSGGRVKQNESGRIMRDNAYGTMAQDAQRRDFTCNALYYDIKNSEVIDFHTGLSDINARQLVMIGEPLERYHEDPVRMLRAIRLSGKLNFTIEARTAEPINANIGLLKNEPVARLFDELLKIIFSGNASGCLKKMGELTIETDFHPMFTALIQAAQNHAQSIEILALNQTDKRISEGKSVSAGFVLAALFWRNVERRWQYFQAAGKKSVGAMLDAIEQMRDEMEYDWGVPQRYSAIMREIWALQPHFENRRGARAYRLLSQVRFRAAYDFLLLRAMIDENISDLASWWAEFQFADAVLREKMIFLLPEQQKKSKKKRKRKRKSKKIEN